MKGLKIFKHRLNKREFKIIRNLELICFIPPKFIKTYIDFLKNKLILNIENEIFIYMRKNWFNHEYSYYNYWQLFHTNSLHLITSHFYSTNNIAESLHNKLALYIPNKKISYYIFIISINNVI